MTSARKWVYITDELIKDWDALRLELNALEIQTLAKNAESEDWYQKQLSNLQSFRKQAEKIVLKHKETINASSQKAVEKTLKETEMLLASMLKDEINTAKPYAMYFEKIEELNQKTLNAVVGIAYNRHQFLTNMIQNDISARKVLQKYTVKDEKMTIIGGSKLPINPVEKIVLDVISGKNSNLGLVITLPSGRNMGLRSYVEMALRTSLQNIATQKLKDSTDNLGIIFFLASSHADCADDHVDYQGKIYVKENWQRFIKPEKIAEIQDFITKKDIKTMEWVIDKPVYFTTRPNCRHYFAPITIEQALGKSIKQLKKELKTEKPMTSEDKELTKKRYAALQEQRRNERAIRTNREKKFLLERMQQTTGNSAEINKQIDAAKANIKLYQARQRQLTKANEGILVRDYSREKMGKPEEVIAKAQAKKIIKD